MGTVRVVRKLTLPCQGIEGIGQALVVNACPLTEVLKIALALVLLWLFH